MKLMSIEHTCDKMPKDEQVWWDANHQTWYNGQRRPEGWLNVHAILDCPCCGERLLPLDTAPAAVRSEAADAAEQVTAAATMTHTCKQVDSTMASQAVVKVLNTARDTFQWALCYNDPDKTVNVPICHCPFCGVKLPKPPSGSAPSTDPVPEGVRALAEAAADRDEARKDAARWKQVASQNLDARLSAEVRLSAVAAEAGDMRRDRDALAKMHEGKSQELAAVRADLRDMTAKRDKLDALLAKARQDKRMLSDVVEKLNEALRAALDRSPLLVPRCAGRRPW